MNGTMPGWQLVLRTVLDRSETMFLVLVLKINVLISGDQGSPSTGQAAQNVKKNGVL